jgi:uncharacterized integral membrane protein
MTDVPRPAGPHRTPADAGGAPRHSAEPAATPGQTTHPLRVTRTSAAWVGIVVFTAVMVLLLIFILQNTKSVEVSFLGASGSLPLAVAMLLAAVAGVALAGIAGSLRIWQLRRRLRRTIASDRTPRGPQ